jgi:site-specific DNA-methyltransferase (adenine-specific)
MVDDDSDGSTIPCESCQGSLKRNFRILDTHLGSGSIAIACHDYGFELTACELDKEYYQKAIERIQNHVNQLKLF